MSNKEENCRRCFCFVYAWVVFQFGPLFCCRVALYCGKGQAGDGNLRGGGKGGGWEGWGRGLPCETCDEAWRGPWGVAATCCAFAGFSLQFNNFEVAVRSVLGVQMGWCSVAAGRYSVVCFHVRAFQEIIVVSARQGLELTNYQGSEDWSRFKTDFEEGN